MHTSHSAIRTISHDAGKIISRGKVLPRLLAIFLAAGLVLSGCNGVNLPSPAQETTPPFSTEITEIPETEETTASQVPTSSPAAQQIILWVPPHFSPQTNTKAGSLLKTRLNEFESQNPGVKILIRTKALSGPAGLLESLSAASSAAPSIMPSLVALSRSDFESAALKGLIYPIESYTQEFDNPDYYDYARSLAFVDNIAFGLPFAGDALLLAYRPGRIGSQPSGWAGILERGQPIVFPAADPQGLMTLALYRSSGGRVQDDQGKPFLNPEILANVLTFYADGARQGGFPTWLSQYQTDAQAWQAYTSQNANWAVTWCSRYLTELPADTTAIALPTIGNEDYSLATGWVWALSDPVSERRELAVKLAEFLVDAEFMKEWTVASNYLPVRPSTTTTWENQSQRSLLEKISLSAELRPDNELTNTLGPLMANATLEIIKNQKDPALVAQEAVGSLY